MIEIGGVRSLDEREVKIIADHLALVFRKVTPERSGAATSLAPSLYDLTRGVGQPSNFPPTTIC